jgi:hypothetical protein
MIPVPAAAPVTTPVLPVTVSAGEVVFHVPPVTGSDSVIVLPLHTEAGPVIAVGVVFTVTVMDDVHPATV